MATALPAPQLITDTTTAATPEQLQAVRALARIMDAAVEIPGTKIKVGLDALIGLLPGIGDAISAAISSYIVLIAGQLGVPKVVIGRMLMNMGIDAVVGFIPFAGDLLDVGWKANTKNVRLLEEAIADPKAARRNSFWMLAGLGLLLVAVVAGITAATWFTLQYIAGRAA